MFLLGETSVPRGGTMIATSLKIGIVGQPQTYPTTRLVCKDSGRSLGRALVNSMVYTNLIAMILLVADRNTILFLLGQTCNHRTLIATRRSLPDQHYDSPRAQSSRSRSHGGSSQLDGHHKSQSPERKEKGKSESERERIREKKNARKRRKRERRRARYQANLELGPN